MTLATRLRMEDYDRYLISLRLPRAVQPALWAVQAFNLELAKIAPTVSEAMLGQIRLQWWREAIDKIASGKTPRQHDVTLAVAKAMQEYALPLPLLHRMIDARAQELTPTPFADIAELLGYLGDTAGILCHLHSHISLGRALDDDETQQARRIGQRWGVIGIIRALPWHTRQGLCFIPQSLLQQHGLSQDTVLSPKHKDNLNALVQSLLAASPLHPQPTLRVCRLYNALTLHYEKIVVKNNYNVMVTSLQKPSVSVMMRLWRL
jgi:phytoene synthase